MMHGERLSDFEILGAAAAANVSMTVCDRRPGNCSRSKCERGI